MRIGGDRKLKYIRVIVPLAGIFVENTHASRYMYELFNRPKIVTEKSPFIWFADPHDGMGICTSLLESGIPGGTTVTRGSG